MGRSFSQPKVAPVQGTHEMDSGRMALNFEALTIDRHYSTLDLQPTPDP